MNIHAIPVFVALLLTSRASSADWSPLIADAVRGTPIAASLVRRIVAHESRGNPSAVNAHGCVGLGQVCPSSQRVCLADPQSAACVERMAALLDPATNVRAVVAILVAERARCKRLGRPYGPRNYLHAYAGVEGRGRACGQRRVRGRWRDDVSPLVTEILTGVSRRHR